MKQHQPTLTYLDEAGAFRMRHPEQIADLVFPLCNEAGMMSSVTPTLHGDAKTGQHHFVLQPVSVEDLHNTKSARNFWLYVHGKGAFSATGNSARQHSRALAEAAGAEPGGALSRTVEAGLLWHRLIVEEPACGIRSELLSFVPAGGDPVELLVVHIANTGSEPVTVTPTAAMPIFARSAENLRDHRHVTSLVNRASLRPEGLVVKPEILFDEKGHRFNETRYFAYGVEGDGTRPVGVFPVARDYIGAGSGFDWPEAVVCNRIPPFACPKDAADDAAGAVPGGVEYVGALRFADAVLAPGASRDYVVLIGCGAEEVAEKVFSRYDDIGKAMSAHRATCAHWEALSGRIRFAGGPDGFPQWMRWIGIQPVLRKIFGNSFLPYHDYGKGGRGWRDLWQDCLALIPSNPAEVRPMLVDNFGGVRVDGTNATIIGSGRGEFIADRNNIARVWMDHGAWPFLTTIQYIDQTGDLDLLLEQQAYFHDGLVARATRRDPGHDAAQGTRRFSGTLLEHMLVQHLTSFFCVGEHNMSRLEGADWNDTLDMARERGESTAFTALYASNLFGLAVLLEKLEDRLGVTAVALAAELLPLLDTLAGSEAGPVDYADASARRAVLARYLDRVAAGFSGDRRTVPVRELAADLRAKAEAVYAQIRTQEWITTEAGDGFFNGYYNNDGERVDGMHGPTEPAGVRMNLTGQVFTTMFGLATPDQARSAYEAVRRYLRDERTGGFRLNTPLGPHRLNFGRGFSFAYGEKENGATFCHMAVMYANALYRQGMAREGYEVFASLYRLSADLGVSGMYPGIPEYFNASGKGLYPWLTGSASWLLLTVLTRMFGVRGECGDLVVEPALMAEQFGSGTAVCVETNFHHMRLAVTIRNEKRLDCGAYEIGDVTLPDALWPFCERTARGIRMPMAALLGYPEKKLPIILDLVPAGATP